MDPAAVTFIQDIVITLHENIRELKERKSFADPEEQSYIEGKVQAYNEILSAMKAAARELKLPAQDLGL